MAEAASDVDRGFALIDAEGSPDDVVFVALLVVAGDVATHGDDIDAGASLYLRAAETCEKLSRTPRHDDPGDLSSLHARAMMGLAQADEVRGYTDRAKRRWSLAAELLERSPGVPPEVLALVRRSAR